MVATPKTLLLLLQGSKCDLQWLVLKPVPQANPGELVTHLGLTVKEESERKDEKGQGGKTHPRPPLSSSTDENCLTTSESQLIT